jgi:hypothetical protein
MTLGPIAVEAEHPEAGWEFVVAQPLIQLRLADSHTMFLPGPANVVDGQEFRDILPAARADVPAVSFKDLVLESEASGPVLGRTELAGNAVGTRWATAPALAVLAYFHFAEFGFSPSLFKTFLAKRTLFESRLAASDAGTHPSPNCVPFICALLGYFQAFLASCPTFGTRTAGTDGAYPRVLLPLLVRVHVRAVFDRAFCASRLALFLRAFAAPSAKAEANSFAKVIGRSDGYEFCVGHQ